jgi:hypothetical protein
VCKWETHIKSISEDEIWKLDTEDGQTMKG